MLISDWSSDVCSSDLKLARQVTQRLQDSILRQDGQFRSQAPFVTSERQLRKHQQLHILFSGGVHEALMMDEIGVNVPGDGNRLGGGASWSDHETGRASRRDRGCQ